MAGFTNFNDLAEYLNDVIAVSLDVKVADTVVRELQDSASKVVYDVYEPHPDGYKRNFSLLDDESYKKIALPYRLIVWPQVKFGTSLPTRNHGYGLERLIEEGNGGGGHYYEYGDENYAYYHARPFVQETKEQLEIDKEHVVSLAEGLADFNVQVTFK